MQSYLKLIPTKNPQRFKVQLLLNSETRHIGILDVQGKTFITKRNANQVFLRSQSIGLNDELLTNKTISFQWVVVEYLDAEGNRHQLVTSRNFVLQYSKCLEFNGERQRFLEICKFGINEAREFEKQKATQGKLFSEFA